MDLGTPPSPEGRGDRTLARAGKYATASAFRKWKGHSFLKWADPRRSGGDGGLRKANQAMSPWSIGATSALKIWMYSKTGG